ncbi:MAG TPA: lanthionine synthetase C family protein, partial [Thermoanaerobaculia bacterium]|nr:lanthionine synthetase C family protein [Thermoanaerobaculia bacterium]
MPDWRPLLQGDLADRAREAAETVALALPLASGWLPMPMSPETETAWNASLAAGDAGFSLLYAYLALGQNASGGDSEENADTALALLDRSSEAVAAVPMSDSLFTGFTGIAWVTEHLEGRLFESDEEAHLGVDEALLDALSLSPWTGDYDLINGLVGLGIYALEGLPRPTAAACLEQVVDRLAERAERSRAAGTTWFSPPEILPAYQRELFPEGLYNFGVSHGIPGIIALLGAACQAGVAVTTAAPLLESAVPWLLARHQGPESSWRFPHFFHPGRDPQPSRLAWCYGDLGIATALWIAARAAGNRVWEQAALDTALSAAVRPPHLTRVMDSGLCHGAGGVAHLFNRLYQATGEERLADAARS